MKTAVAAILALALAACSNGSPSAAEEDLAANRVEAFAQHNAAAAAIRGLPGNDVPRPAVATKQLSPAFHGRWGITLADCDFSRSDTKGLVTVYPDRLSFYESTAKIDALVQHSQAKVTVDLSFTGEGQTWRQRDGLELISGGTMLVRTEASTIYRYARC